MDNFIYSLNATMPVFLVMVIGRIIRKLGLIDEHFTNILNKYVFYVALPALLFQDIASSPIQDKFDLPFVLLCMLGTTGFFGIVWFFTQHFLKDRSMRSAFIQASCRSSAAILGLAFIQNMYDNTGMAPLMIVASVPLFNIYSVLILTLYDDSQPDNGRSPLMKALIGIAKNPIILGILAGIPFSLLNVKFPFIIDKTIENIARTASPLALIAIGSGFQLRASLKKLRPTLVATTIKLVLIAACIMPIAIWMGYRNQELVALLIMTASPSTATCYVMAKNMHGDGDLSSGIIVLTTLLSSVTLTAWIFLFRSLGYL